MSIPVALDGLRAAVAERTLAPYLLTVNDDGRPHAVAVQPVWDGDALVADAGRRTCTNAAARPLVSLVWPAADGAGYSLIVDGDASVDGGRVRVVPTTAVLHRPAPSPAAPADGGCGNDCVPVG
jgi:hypothetical protein